MGSYRRKGRSLSVLKLDTEPISEVLDEDEIKD